MIDQRHTQRQTAMGSMADGHQPSKEDPTIPQLSEEGRKTVQAVRKALEDALSQIQSEAEAEEIIDQVMAAIDAMSADTTEEVREQEGQTSEREARRAIEQASETAGSKKLQTTLIEAARQISRGEGEARAALEEAVQQATNPEQHGEETPQTRQSRDWVMRAVVKRMKPIQRFDARLFMLLNGIPHTALTNKAFYGLSTVMNAGGGWVLFLLGAALFDGRRGHRALHGVLLPLWLATMAVEFPIKRYFRRRRPFLDVVQAVAVGRKPIGYSFPSGHSAAAFAGAWLLRKYYPKLWPLWYTIAALVGFSRVYLGVHYPGDVMSGALTGTAIAELSRWSIAQSNKQVANPNDDIAM